MVEKIAQCVGYICFNIRRINNYLIRTYEKTLFKSIGKECFISTGCTFTYRNVTIGSNTYIGKNCVIQSEHGEIFIGNNVMLGPGVHIHGGNHEYRHIGKLMRKITKTSGSDGVITIGDDTWIGANALILKGVSIGGERYWCRFCSDERCRALYYCSR